MLVLVLIDLIGREPRRCDGTVSIGCDCRGTTTSRDCGLTSDSVVLFEDFAQEDPVFPINGVLSVAVGHTQRSSSSIKYLNFIIFLIFFFAKPKAH